MRCHALPRAKPQRDSLNAPDLLGRQILALVLVPPPRSLIILAVDHVRVDFRRHANRGMPKAGGDHRKRHTISQEMGCVRVAQRVEASTGR